MELERGGVVGMLRIQEACKDNYKNSSVLIKISKFDFLGQPKKKKSSDSYESCVI